MMRVITCASYYGTGSSAVTDFITEFNSVYSMGDYDTDGIADLEYHLVWNHNRHNSGHALKRFKKIVDFYAGNKLVSKYEPFFQNKWKKLAYHYINELLDFSYKGWWQYDLLDKGEHYYYFKMIFNKIFQKTLGRNTEKVLDILPNEITYCSRPSQEEFDSKTKKFLSELLTVANKGNKPYLMVDQLLPSSNLNRFWKFFDDIKVIIVERDPRDLYILEKYVWKGNIIPTENVNVFCDWYRYTRAHRKTEVLDKEKVLLIQFEDLIYKYEETTKKLCDWLGLDAKDHARPLQKLNPERSKKNTRLWLKYNVDNEMETIERNLSEYIYKYD